MRFLIDESLPGDLASDLVTAGHDVLDVAAERRAGLRISNTAAAPEREPGSFVSWNLFDLLGVAPALGRSFVVDDERAGAAPVALVSYTLWQQRYAGDPSILGRTIVINGTARTIVGVMPRALAHPGLRGLSGARVWVPLAQMTRAHAIRRRCACSAGCTMA